MQDPHTWGNLDAGLMCNDSCSAGFLCYRMRGSFSKEAMKIDLLMTHLQLKSHSVAVASLGSPLLLRTTHSPSAFGIFTLWVAFSIFFRRSELTSLHPTPIWNCGGILWNKAQPTETIQRGRGERRQISGLFINLGFVTIQSMNIDPRVLQADLCVLCTIHICSGLEGNRTGMRIRLHGPTSSMEA